MSTNRDVHQVDHDLAREAEEQRDRIDRGMDGAHKPEDKSPYQEAQEEAVKGGQTSGPPRPNRAAERSPLTG